MVAEDARAIRGGEDKGISEGTCIRGRSCWVPIGRQLQETTIEVIFRYNLRVLVVVILEMEDQVSLHPSLERDGLMGIFMELTVGSRWWVLCLFL